MDDSAIYHVPDLRSTKMIKRQQINYTFRVNNTPHFYNLIYFIESAQNHQNFVFFLTEQMAINVQNNKTFSIKLLLFAYYYNE